MTLSSATVQLQTSYSDELFQKPKTPLTDFSFSKIKSTNGRKHGVRIWDRTLVEQNSSLAYKPNPRTNSYYSGCDRKIQPFPRVEYSTLYLTSKSGCEV